MSVRVRFAPSPTGYLHVGGARTALFNFLYAKKEGGEFVLRVEDTDQERSTAESLQMQLQDLDWLGLTWQEGPCFQDVKKGGYDESGPFGPYRQSQRKDIYKKYADILLKQGQAYYCFLTDEEIDQQKKDGAVQIQSPYRDMPYEEAQKMAQEKPFVVRFKVQKKEYYIVQDLIRGEVKLPSDMVGDFVLVRSNGMPVYNFCCVVDDALMQMTHVFRAEEHLPNSLRQLMVYEALSSEFKKEMKNFKTPQFGHFSIILGEDRQKLSKRHGATSCNEYFERGFFPEALLNFMALLGWSHPEGKEILSLEELVKSFSLDRINPASAVFDESKLRWMNAQYLREYSAQELLKKFLHYKGEKVFCEFFSYSGAVHLKSENITDEKEMDFQAVDSLDIKISERLEKALKLYQTAHETLGGYEIFFSLLSNVSFSKIEELQKKMATSPEEALKKEELKKEVLSWDETKKVVNFWKEQLEKQTSPFISQEEFLNIQDEIKKACEVKGKKLFMPIRLAVLGEPQGYELKDLIPLISVDTLLERAKDLESKIL